MTTTAKNVGSYAQNQQAGESIRETEARALLNCASRLAAARDINNGYEYYSDAIKHNQELWTLFQVLLADPQNPLPRDLKITLLNLSRYVDKVSLRASAEYNPDLLNSLIDINKQIAAGLSASPSEAQAAG
jgi:flagellar protein FlaF